MTTRTLLGFCDSAYLLGSLTFIVLLLATPIVLFSSRPFFRDPSLRKVHLSLLIAMLCTLAIAFPFWRINCGVGVLVFHGSDYWVNKATKEPDDRLALGYLHKVLDSSHKGYAAAEMATYRLPDISQRKRMFTLLSTAAAPNEGLSERYKNFAAACTDGNHSER